MRSHQAFEFYSKFDPEMRQNVSVGAVHCCECGRKEERRMQTPGLANRIFHNEGWLLGSRRSTDVCPSCRASKKHRAMTKDEKVKAYRQIEKRIAEQDGHQTKKSGGAATKAKPAKVVNNVMEVKLGEALKGARLEKAIANCRTAREKQEEFLAEAAQKLHPVEKDGVLFGMFTVKDGHAGYPQAYVAARIFLQRRFGVVGARPGVHFRVINRGTSSKVEGANYEYELLGEWAAVNDRLARRADYPGRAPGAHRKYKMDGGAAAKETKVETQAVKMPVVDEKDVLPVVEAKDMPPVTARKPTLHDNKRVYDALSEHYDEDKQRYRGAWSDRKVAEHLDVPAAWVKSCREQFFGVWDRNEFAEKRCRELDEAIAMAEAAEKTLLEMATKAETLKGDLLAARKKLEG